MSENKILTLGKGKRFHIKASGAARDAQVITPEGENISAHVMSVTWSIGKKDIEGNRSKVPIVTLELLGVDMEVDGELYNVEVFQMPRRAEVVQELKETVA